MSTQQSTRSRQLRRVRKGSRRFHSRSLLVFLLGLAMLPLGLPAQAALDPGPLLGAPPANNSNTDIVITSLGAGTRVSGGLPPLGQTWPIDAYPAGVPAGYQTENVNFAGIINTQDASGTTTAEMYCIDLRTSTRAGIGYENGSWDESNVPNIGYVNRILNNYYPSTNLPAGVNNNTRAAAVQAAIWFFTDGYVVNRQSSIYSTVASIVNATIAAGPLEEPDPPAIAITPPTTGAPVTGVAGPHTVTSEADEIELTVDEGFSLYADADGTVPLNSPVPSGTQIWVRSDTGATGPANLTARAAVTVPTGNVYLYDAATPGVDNAQKLILAVTRELSSNATAAAAFTEVGSLTVTKTIAGPAAGNQDAVVITIDCGADNQFTFNVDAGATGTQSQTFNDIPAGSTCTVAEPTDGSNESVAVSTILPGAVTIVSGTSASATVTDTYTFAPGTLVVTKTNTGEAAGAQDEVTISVVCTLGGTTVLDTTETIPAGTTDPTSFEFPNLEANTSCTVTETVTGETTRVNVTVTGEGAVTVPAGSSVTAALTNDYTFAPGTLAVRKDIAGPGAGRQGVVTLQVTCTAGGATVLNTTVTVAAGTTEPTTQEFAVAAGADCTVTETANGATTEVSVETVVEPATGTVTIPAGDGVEVVFTDTYTVNPGALTVDKVITGPAAREQGPITVEVVCTAGGEEVIRRDLIIEAGAGGTIPGTVSGIPEGASCAVSEPATGETPAVGVTVDLPEDVTIAAGETAEATVTNTYAVNPGSLTVTKVIAGDAAGNQDSVEVDVLCTLDGETVFEEVSQVPAGTTEDVGAVFSNIPAGASCSITEPVTGATAAVTVDSDLPAEIEILAGDTVDTTVTNTYSFAPGTLAVTKVFAGEAAGQQGDVVLQVTCGPDGSVLDETVTIPAGTTETATTNFAGLPTGTACTVTETDSGATADVAVVTDVPDPVAIPAGEGAELTVTNTYTYGPGVLMVTKVIAGEAAGEQGEIILQVRCGPDGSVLDETVTIPAGATGEVTTEFDGLAAGSECTVTEAASGATSAVQVASVLPSPVTIPVRGTATAEVSNTFSFVAGSGPADQPDPAGYKPSRPYLPATGLEVSAGAYLALGAGLCLIGGLGIFLGRRPKEEN